MLSAFILKLFAIVTMAMDHTGAVLFPGNEELRIIGRLAFPIFCFLISEGFVHTKSVQKYLMRLGIFAVVSEIPFNLAFHRKLICDGCNVFVTLFLGLLALYLYDLIMKWEEVPKAVSSIAALIPVVLSCVTAQMIGSDYERYGVMLIFIFYIFRDNRTCAIIAFFLCTEIRYGLSSVSTERFDSAYSWLKLFEDGDVTWYISSSIQQYCILSAIPIALYNGKKGEYSFKWAFYVFYPAHLILLWLIKLIVK